MSHPPIAANQFLVYGRPGCGYCSAALQLLQRRGEDFIYVDIWKEGIDKSELAERFGGPVYTVPQILHGDIWVGGYSDLVPYLQKQE